MDFFAELLKWGPGGLLAAIFLGFYIQERKDHAVTREKYIASIEARREDSKENVNKVTNVLDGMAVGIKGISDKIEVSKGVK